MGMNKLIDNFLNAEVEYGGGLERQGGHSTPAFLRLNGIFHAISEIIQQGPKMPKELGVQSVKDVPCSAIFRENRRRVQIRDDSASTNFIIHLKAAPVQIQGSPSLRFPFWDASFHSSFLVVLPLRTKAVPHSTNHRCEV